MIWLSHGEAPEADRRASIDVAEVGADAGRGDDVVQAQRPDQRVHLQQQRQRLTDPARGAWYGFILRSGSGLLRLWR